MLLRRLFCDDGRAFSRAGGAGVEHFFAGLSSLLRAKREPEKHPLLSRRGRHEKGAARPFQTPKELSKPKNASRFAKRIFLCFSHLRLRRRFHVSAGRYRQQRGNTRCEAANRRNEKKVQQRRPPPAADTGRSCWGRGQQDTSATQGTKWSLGTATRLSAAASFFPFRQLLRDYQGRAALDSCLPRLGKAALFWFSFGAQKRT